MGGERRAGMVLLVETELQGRWLPSSSSSLPPPAAAGVCGWAGATSTGWSLEESVVEVMIPSVQEERVGSGGRGW